MSSLSAAFRLSSESLIPVEDVARDLHTIPETVIRWATRGRHGRKLDAVKRDGKWFTSIAALARFQSQEGATA